jgi:HEPN domain-containing protein
MAGPADIAGMLLGAAVDDELVARSLLPIEGVTDAALGFHAQQAVEKSLKAVLALRKIEFPYSHDLDGLVQLCRKNGIEVPEDLAGVDDLSPFAARLRYGVIPSTSLDRNQGVALGRLRHPVGTAADRAEGARRRLGTGHGPYSVAPGCDRHTRADRGRRWVSLLHKVLRLRRLYYRLMRDMPADLPGHELVTAGLEDLAAGRETEAALVVAMAAPRLRALGFDVPASDGGGQPAHHRLYALLARERGAHSRYNALVARVVSFARAAEHASSR